MQHLITNAQSKQQKEAAMKESGDQLIKVIGQDLYSDFLEMASTGFFSYKKMSNVQGYSLVGPNTLDSYDSKDAGGHFYHYHTRFGRLSLGCSLGCTADGRLAARWCMPT